MPSLGVSVQPGGALGSAVDAEYSHTLIDLIVLTTLVPQRGYRHVMSTPNELNTQVFNDLFFAAENGLVELRQH